MKELSEIIAAFEALCAEGKSAALATVIAVEGSAYRRPGARMLVAADGRTWGGISGGCLERDVARRALGVIETARPLRCRYDTGDDDAIAAGTSTGCGGAVELFIQPVTAAAPGPIPFFAHVRTTRQPLTLCTVVRSADTLRTAQPGTCWVLDGGADDASFNHPLASIAIPHWTRWHDDRRPHLASDSHSGEIFIERLLPPQALVVFGAGPDAVPLVSIAKTLGWHVTVVGSRPATGMSQRFGKADALHVTSSDNPTAGVYVPPDAAVVVMTHHFQRDATILAHLSGPVEYLGVLGPRHRTRRLLDSLPEGEIRGVASSRLFAPMGLDLGADTPEEVALAVVAEIQSVLRRSTSQPLRTRPGPIHNDGPHDLSSEDLPRKDDQEDVADPRRSPVCKA